MNSDLAQQIRRYLDEWEEFKHTHARLFLQKTTAGYDSLIREAGIQTERARCIALVQDEWNKWLHDAERYVEKHDFLARIKVRILSGETA